MEKVGRCKAGTDRMIMDIVEKLDDIVDWINKHEKPSEVPRMTKFEWDAKWDASEAKRRVKEALK